MGTGSRRFSSGVDVKPTSKGRAHARYAATMREGVTCVRSGILTRQQGGGRLVIWPSGLVLQGSSKS